MASKESKGCEDVRGDLIKTDNGFVLLYEMLRDLFKVVRDAIPLLEV
jgi:hypothetical protein